MMCIEGTIPGWLGEDGLPTSCVDDHAELPVKGDTALILPGIPRAVLPLTPSPAPTPEPTPDAIQPGMPVTIQPIAVLAHTAAPDTSLIGVVLLFVVAGMLLRRLSRLWVIS